ncbi:MULTISPECIES: alpha-keto acid decarboxylase family protein [Paenibacillus]|uniref:alpha-keto acid decarboxylase family protein n=1 Tax=Paenibacillus TaxID=44249 RepID=UPI0022B8C8D2|nr:thiamine pyrophosphate-binding protein [Paenibacillus caseinilyticus]MCZ8520420.1 thiamine pyrophosphate-binding protein [Paenibacillus caseinilyticus]
MSIHARSSERLVPTPGEGATLGRYLFDCLRREGITEIFGVPGDYNFTLLDTLEQYGGITFVNGRNELNAGYAADGYARVKGLAALITTFGVGEMSAAGAIAGSCSESVPVIHVVGSPKSSAQQEHRLMHHSLLDGDFGVFLRVHEGLTAYTAVLTPDNAAAEIPKAIRIAKEGQKPVYLVVAIDLVEQPVVQREEELQEENQTNRSSLEAAAAHALRLLEEAGSAAILTDLPVLRYGLQEEVQRLAEALNAPAASMMLGKGGFDERHPNYIGIYGGLFGSDEVREIVEGAGIRIAAGLVRSDGNTANFTAPLDAGRLIDIQPHEVRIGEEVYAGVPAAEMLRTLRESGWKCPEKRPAAPFPYAEASGGPDEPLRSEAYYPRFERMLEEGDIVVAETGTLGYGMAEVRLPKGATYIHQGGWQSIGYATPAAFGAAVAAPERRVLLFTGDGSLQLTVQEVSSMLAYGCRPILFVLNNGGYTVEKYLNVKTQDQKYNEIPRWSYTKLAEAFGGEAYTAEVRTIGELDAAIEEAQVQCAERLCVIELIAADPMDAPAFLRKKRAYLKQQARQQK